MSADSGTAEPLISGEVDSRFAGPRDEFRRQLASGEELGASIAVVEHGTPVVDLWGG